MLRKRLDDVRSRKVVTSDGCKVGWCGKELVLKENPALKKSLVLQSFAPLFFLLLIKHAYLRMPMLIVKFFTVLRSDGLQAIKFAIDHPLLWDLVIVSISLCWLFLTALVVFGFKGIQSSGFISNGENVVVSEEKRDVGISFLVSFVLPLLVDEVMCIRDFFFFSTMLVLVLCLLIRSNLFYQNPILTLLGYRVCSFKVIDPAADLLPYEGKEFIGITYGKPITDQAPIKRKYIADDVFLIYND